jgi:hypothetical protein
MAHEYVYNLRTGALANAAGKTLKRLACPKFKCWEDLTPTEQSAQVRSCRDCGDAVLSVRGIGARALEALLAQQPGLCLYVDPADPAVRIEPGADDGGLPRIRTARTLEDMNRAAAGGLRPLVKRVEHSPAIRSKMAVYQKVRTGEVAVAGDFRYSRMPGWVMVIDWFSYHPGEHAGSLPIAAYLVPPDLQPGTRVLLTDVIEDLVASRWNQGDAMRLDRCEAVWTGSDFELCAPEPMQLVG